MNIKEMIPHNVERLLAELGLEKRRSAGGYLLPALGVFAAGAVVGGLLALLLAPSSGRELRGRIERKLRPGGDVDPSPQREHRATTKMTPPPGGDGIVG